MKIKKIFSTVISIAICLSVLSINVNADNYMDNNVSVNSSTNMYDELTEDNTSFTENSIDTYEVEYVDMFENTYKTNFTLPVGNGGGINLCSTLNWTVKAGGISRTSSEWELMVGDFIDFDLTFSPALESSELKIGLYNVNTKKTQYISHSGGKIKGKYFIKTDGTYKLEIKNTSIEDVSVSGTVNFAILKDIGVRLCSQEKSNWCWAACSEMVSEYYGYPTTQTDIVTEVKKGIVNVSGSPEDIKNAIEFATSNKYTTPGSYKAASGISDISNQINNLKPVIMFFVVNGENHVCVATAVDKNGIYVKYNNPAPMNIGQVCHKKYSELISDSSNKYTQYMTISAK